MERFKICSDCDFPGVYAIVNTSNQKIYIGSSKNIKIRLDFHKTRLKNNKSRVKKMQEDFNNGNDFVSFVVTPVSLSQQKSKECDNLRYFEGMAISKFKSFDPRIGYNKNTGCFQLVEILNIMEATENIKKLDYETLLNKEWRF